MKNISLKHMNQRFRTILGTSKNRLPSSQFSSGEVINFFFSGKINAFELYFILVGTYPSLSALNKLNQYSYKQAKVIELLDEEILKSCSPKNRIYLKPVSSKFVMDVTQTATLNFTSGIQRVVREVFSSSYEDIELGIWRNNGEIFQLLSSSQRNELAEGSAVRNYNLLEEGIENCYLSGQKILLFESSNWNANIYHNYGQVKDINEITTLIYDDIPIRSPYFTDERTRNGFPVFLKSALDFSRNILCISTNQLNNIKQWHNFFELHNEVRFLPIKLPPLCSHDPIKKNLPIADSKKRILVVGSFDLRKNVLAVFASLARLPKEINLEVVLIGPGGNLQSELFLFRKFAKAIKGRNVEIEILKNVSNTELHSQYLLADFSVFLSFSEGFGLPALESIQHGTPVIVSNVPEILEAAGDYGCVPVDPDDVVEISSVILKMCTEENYLWELSQSCHKNRNLNRSWTQVLLHELTSEGNF